MDDLKPGDMVIVTASTDSWWGSHGLNIGTLAVVVNPHRDRDQGAPAPVPGVLVTGLCGDSLLDQTLVAGEYERIDPEAIEAFLNS